MEQRAAAGERQDGADEASEDSARKVKKKPAARGRGRGRGRGKGGQGRGQAKAVVNLASDGEEEEVEEAPEVLKRPSAKGVKRPEPAKPEPSPETSPCKTRKTSASETPTKQGGDTAKVATPSPMKASPVKAKAKAKAKGQAKQKVQAKGTAKAKAKGRRSGKAEMPESTNPSGSSANKKVKETERFGGRSTFAGRRSPTSDPAKARYQAIAGAFFAYVGHKFQKPSSMEAACFQLLHGFLVHGSGSFGMRWCSGCFLGRCFSPDAQEQEAEP